jgi:glycosyltransferase involved in cell wall biosynthesis
MILLVSHFTSRKGTTDYFRDYLINKKISHYYLRHPLGVENIAQYSELIYSDGTKDLVINKYKKFKFLFFELVRTYMLNICISIFLNYKVNLVIGFGGFNTAPFIFTKKFYKTKVYFWGVDYSPKRFKNIFLSKIYLYLETYCCKNASLTISVSQRQENIRIKKHRLDLRNSIIISNGVYIIDFSKKFSDFNAISFIYIGSLTYEHGILDFIKKFKLENKKFNNIYIFGSGFVEPEINEYIKSNGLLEKVFVFGNKSCQEIREFLIEIKENLFGIAPYIIDTDSHAYYGDGLKIKEYLNYNIPYLVKENTYIPKDLMDFGILYNDSENLNDVIYPKLSEFNLNYYKKNLVIKKYSWSELFNLLKYE